MQLQERGKTQCARCTCLGNASALHCVHTVMHVLQANYNATLDGPIPNATETWTSYTLTFNGQCASNYLTSYGKSGPVGKGVSLLDTTGIRSNYVNATMLVPAANISTAG